MSTASHPQTDGQTERQNRTLEEAVRSYVNYKQDDWDQHLIALELAYNSSVNRSTGFTPHYLNHGYDMQLPLDAAMQPSRQSNNPTAADRIQLIHDSVRQAKANLQQAQQRQTHYANQHRKDVEFKVGDKVMLSTGHLNLKDKDKSKKFTPRFIGPFAITKVISPVSYELALPSTMRIHPVFHVSKLQRYRERQGIGADASRSIARPEPEYVNEDGEELWEVEQIVNKRLVKLKGSRRRVEYLVKWKGYSDYEMTWEPATKLMQNAKESVEAYESSLLSSLNSNIQINTETSENQTCSFLSCWTRTSNLTHC